MNYVTELEGMEGHPDDLKLKLLRNNIEEAEMLFVVYGFNAKSWIEEFNLAFTEIETQELLVNITTRLNITLINFFIIGHD